MKLLKRWLKNKLSQKPGFWFFQITGWLVFAIGMKLYYSDSVIDSFLSFYKFYITYFVGFLLTLGMRFFYRSVIRTDRSILFIILMIITASTVGLLIWEPLDVLVSLPFWTSENLRSFLETYQPFSILRYYRMNIFWLLVILLWSVLYFGIKIWMELIEERNRSEKAALLAQKSQLQMLRYQLNPHFLFNSLNSIQALVYEDPKHADRMISELSDFLRFSLQDKDRIFIPLGDEVKIVEKYLSMEKTRFPERLEYTIDVTEQAARLEVVGFILQPFVENAVKHGMKSSPEKLTVCVKGYTEAKRLFLEVKNSGSWIENTERKGTGIQNVYDRLQNAYPDKYKIHILKNPTSVYVIIEISL